MVDTYLYEYTFDPGWYLQNYEMRFKTFDLLGTIR